MDLAHIDKQDPFSGLSKAHPVTAKEWNDCWYMHNIFLLDARDAMLACWDTDKPNQGLSPPISAWLRWINQIGDRNAGLSRNLQIDTDFFSAKIRITGNQLRESRVDVELVFRREGTTINGSSFARQLRRALYMPIEQLRPRIAQEGVTTSYLKDLVKIIFELVPVCCYAVRGDMIDGRPMQFPRTNCAMFIAEHVGKTRCRESSCKMLKGYLG